MKSKTIILSQPENKGRGILTLFQENDLLQCRIRLYNVEKLSRYCKIGVYHQNEVYSANLLERNGVYESSFVGNFDIDKDFYAAIINTANNNQVILSGGTYAGYFFNDNSVFEKENNCFKTIEKEQPNTNLFTYAEDDELSNLYDTFEDEKNTISTHNFDKILENENMETTHNFDKTNNSKFVECSDNCDKCATCKYKEYFYNHNPESCHIERNEVKSKYPDASATLSMTKKEENNTQFRQNNCHPERSVTQSNGSRCFDKLSMTDNNSSSNNNSSNNNENDNKKSVIQAIIPQFKYVFENYEQDDILTALIPNSRFVKINENNMQYSIGAIYENEEMKYICYAVMCNYNTPAPTELGEHYQWLPLDKEDPLSEGYYIVFQDASDLKILEL